MKETVIYLIRHGLTCSNKEKIYAGWSEEELDKEGVVQAEKVGEKLKGLNISIIYASPIKRALQTAEILNKHLGVEVIAENDLKEMKIGPWEGMSEKEVASRYPVEYKIWHTQPTKLRLPGRETLYSVQKRAIRSVAKIVETNKNKACLMITHVAVIRCLLLFFNKWDLDLYGFLDVTNVSLFKLDFNKEHIAIPC